MAALVGRGRGRPAGPIEPAAALPGPRPGLPRAPHRAAPPPPQARTRPHRLAAAHGPFDRIPRALPARPQPPQLAGPADRAGDPPPLRAPQARRPAPHGRQEAGPHPPRRRLARPRPRSRPPSRPRSRPPSRPQPRWLRLHPLRGRRPLPPRLQRGPRRRARGHHGRLLAAGLRLVRRARRHRARRAHRQRPRLSQLRVRARASPPACAVAAHGPTTPRPTARSSASTVPSSRSGPMSASTAARRLVPPPLRSGCTATIITAVTPPSAATLRSAVSPTSRKITASARDDSMPT